MSLLRANLWAEGIRLILAQRLAHRGALVDDDNKRRTTEKDW